MDGSNRGGREDIAMVIRHRDDFLLHMQGPPLQVFPVQALSTSWLYLPYGAVEWDAERISKRLYDQKWEVCASAVPSGPSKGERFERSPIQLTMPQWVCLLRLKQFGGYRNAGKVLRSQGLNWLQPHHAHIGVQLLQVMHRVA